MFIPYSDEPSEEGTPWVNWLLIAANVYFFLTLAQDEGYDRIIQQWGFTPSRMQLPTLFTSLFLHANFMHLIGNLWFLYLFGDNVECKIGHVPYLIAYLLSGVAGDLSHWAFFAESDIPSIGASGAIFGVLGMYVVLFPFNHVKVFYFIFILIGRTVIPALWVIGLFFGMELLFSKLQTMSGAEGGIGHLAHAGGFIAGAGVALFMVSTGMLSGRRRDLLAYVTGRGEGLPVKHVHEISASLDDSESPASQRPADAPPEYALSKHDPRYDIVAALHAGRTDRAMQLWREFAIENLDAVLPVREQLELAMALDRSGATALARDAYERLLAYYKDHPVYTAEAQLSLAGMLLQHAEETGDKSDLPHARRLLKAASAHHPDAARRQLAAQWLALAN